MDGRALNGRGRVDLEEVEEVVGGDIGFAGAEEDGEDAVVADGLVERGDEVIFGDGSLFKELFHQLVLAFGDELDQGLVGFLGGVGHSGGDFSGLAAAVAVGRVVEGLHGDEVDHALEAVGVDDGKLDGDAGAAPALFQVVNERGEAATAAGLGVVHLIDDDDAGDVGFFSVSPNALGDGLDAALGVDDDDGGFNGKECGAGFMTEHVEAGRV